MESMIIQYILVFFLSMIPFFEVFVTVPMGIVLFNFPIVVVLLVAIVGNASSVLFFMFFGGKVNQFVYTILRKFGKENNQRKNMNPRMKTTFDRFGVNGVCFLSSILFSSQLGSGAMMTIGAERSRVFIWTNLGVGSLAITMAILSVVAEGFVLSLLNGS